jgi:hypothetical protein
MILLAVEVPVFLIRNKYTAVLQRSVLRSGLDNRRRREDQRGKFLPLSLDETPRGAASASRISPCLHRSFEGAGTIEWLGLTERNERRHPDPGEVHRDPAGGAEANRYGNDPVYTSFTASAIT